LTTNIFGGKFSIFGIDLQIFEVWMSNLTSATVKYATQVIAGNAIFGAACYYGVPAFLSVLQEHSQKTNTPINLKSIPCQDSFEKSHHL
jgi:hypothetical protein